MNVFLPEGSLNNSNPVLGVFDTSGTLLKYDDDSGIGYNSYLSYYISTPGTYIAGVSGFNGLDNFSDGGDTDFYYDLHIETDASIAPNPAPLPATILLFGGALISLVGYGYRKNS